MAVAVLDRMSAMIGELRMVLECDSICGDRVVHAGSVRPFVIRQVRGLICGAEPGPAECRTRPTIDPRRCRNCNAVRKKRNRSGARTYTRTGSEHSRAERPASANRASSARAPASRPEGPDRRPRCSDPRASAIRQNQQEHRLRTSGEREHSKSSY